ncbi:MAG TPA: CHASE2 domain-containing protein [Abditibacteriaceae bacterium]
MPRFSPLSFKQRFSKRPDKRAENWQRTAAWGVLLGCTVALSVLLLLSHSSIGGRLQYDTLDFWFRLRDPLLPRAVAILAIDEDTIHRWNGRSVQADDISRLLRELKRQQVSAVALALPELATATLREREQKTLAQGLKQSGIGFLPLHFRNAATLSVPRAPLAIEPLAGIDKFVVGAGQKSPMLQGQDEPLSLYSTLRLDSPDATLLASASGGGFLNFPLEADGRVRQVPLLLPHDGDLYPALPLAAFLGARRLNTPTSRSNVRLVNGLGQTVPFSHAQAINVGPFVFPCRSGHLLLNFPTGPSLDAPLAGDARHDPLAISPSPFHTISVDAALRNPRVLAPLKGKAVVIGLTAPARTVFYQGPNSRRVPGVEIYAIALDNLLTNRALHRLPDMWLWLFTFVPSALIGGFVTARRPSWSGLVTCTSLCVIALLSLGLFARNVWLDISAPWLSGSLTYVIGVVSRARRQERESTRVESTIEAVSQVSEVIAAQTQPNELFSRLLDWAMDLMQSDSAAALLLDEDGQTLRFAATTGPKAADVLPLTVKVGEGVAGWVALHGQPAIVNDTQSDARFARHFDRDTGFATQSILCVPLRLQGKILGVIEVINRVDGHPFMPGDADLLMAVANQAAVVLENARLYEVLNLRVERSESALERSNRRLETERNLFSAVLQSMTGGVIVTDAEGQIQLVNPAAQRLLPELTGWNQKPLDERRISNLIPDFFLDATMPRVELKRGDPDAPRLIEAQSALLHGQDGQADENPTLHNMASGWIVVLDDVTEARYIDRAKSDFVSFVAHEMRSPLTSIAGFASMLQRNEGLSNTASRVRFLGLIKGESERLTRLINSLLDVARIEAGRPIELLREEQDIQELALAACESQRAYSSRHTIVCNVPPQLPPVWADRDKVLQILINLISNALKYAPGGQVIVSARRAGEFIEISVRDEGPGIPQEQRRLLFERFGRATTPVAGAGSGAKPTGTGLGLFLAKHLTETHGGTIRASSGASGGAVFTFTLPVAEAEKPVSEIDIEENAAL